jgi:ferrous iron transport protein B
MTIMMAPFMSCGARLAIFAVFAAAFFGQNGALAVFSLYVLGIVMAILTGLMLKHTIMRGEASPFVMELPVYHVPHIKSLIIQTWQRLKGFVLRAGKVIVIVSIFLSALNSFSLSGKVVDNINDSALASVSRVITPVFKPIGVHEDNWQATVGLFTGAMAKEVVVGTLNTLYTAEDIQNEEFNPQTFSLGEELLAAVDETWQGLKDTFSLSVLANPIEASKGDGEMATGAMGVMGSKFGSAAAAYSYLIFVLLYIPCISVMGAIARESSRGWMTFSILWGLNIAYSLSTLYYQTVSFSDHPRYSLVCILAVVLFNVVLFGLLRRARSRVDVSLLATENAGLLLFQPGWRLPLRRAVASLMEVRDMLALQGRMEAKQLSARLRTPQPLIDAMLERMEAMGKVVRISETSEGCLSGSCKSCPEGKAACQQEWWALR